MSNPVFKHMKNQVPMQPQNMQPQQIDYEKLYKQFQENPQKYLAPLNLPSEIQTPEQAVRYLAANNQIPPIMQKQVYGMLAKIGNK